MENIENILKELLSSFIREMNEWEKLCNKTDSDNSLTHDAQMALLKEAKEKIFDKYVTQRKRVRGGPDEISYGQEGSYDYDPENEIIFEITVDKNKATISTQNSIPMEERKQYLLKRTKTGWLIDSKKRYSFYKERWESVNL